MAARRFMSFLNDLISQVRGPGYILVVGRKTEELSAEFNATIFKNCQQMRIGRLDRDRTDSLIQGLAEDRLHFTEEALARIYELTGGHPFCTQALCWALWSRLVHEDSSFPIAVERSAIEEILVPAVEMATNGLNWVYDGLSEPEHRLFLSAMAQVADPRSAVNASEQEIEFALLDKGVAIDTLELSRAPKELERWDIISRQQEGLHFAVPMIGLWIRLERPLEVLEREVRLVNPRAHRYYELGAEAHAREDWDRAIRDYRSALEANPVFPEALRALAIALRNRRKPGDLAEAVEVRERIREQDPSASVVALLEVLIEILDVAELRTDQALRYYARLKELDSKGRFRQQAERKLTEKASQMLDGGRYSQALLISQSMGDEKAAQVAKMRRTISLVKFFLATIAGMTLLELGMYPYTFGFGLPFGAWAQRLMGAFAGGALSTSASKSIRYP